jgi:RNA polymerase-binding transcription factor DksA
MSASHLCAVSAHSCAGTTHCVLCGKRIGDLRFRGFPVCNACIEYARTVS